MSLAEYAEALLHGRAPPGHLTTQLDDNTHIEQPPAAVDADAAAVGKPDLIQEQQPGGGEDPGVADQAEEKEQPEGQPAKKRRRVMVDNAALKKFSRIESALVHVFGAED